MIRLVIVVGHKDDGKKVFVANSDVDADWIKTRRTRSRERRIFDLVGEKVSK